MVIQTRLLGSHVLPPLLGALAVAACFTLPGAVGLSVAAALVILAAGAAFLGYRFAIEATRGMEDGRLSRIARTLEQAATQGEFNLDMERVPNPSSEVDRIQNGVVDLMRGMNQPLTRLSTAVDEMGRGDLTIDLRAEAAAGAMRELLDRMDRMRLSLAEVVADVQGDGGQVAESAEQLSAAIEEMSSTIDSVATTIQEVTRAAQSQSSQVAQASHSLSQTAEQLRRTAEESRRAADRVASAASASAEGRTSAMQASQRMNEVTTAVDQSGEVVRSLAESVSRISDFVTIIVRISDQTNLLALNAAIEAARAGEHGRGFAVVAEEVRKLAEESARGAAEVQRVIEHITSETTRVVQSMDAGTREVYEGTKVVTQAIGSFEQVSGQVEEVAGLVNRIAAAVDEVSRRGDALVQNVESVSASAEEMAASAEEVSAAIEEQTASMEELAATSQDLARSAAGSLRSVERFRLPDGLTSRARRAAGAPGRGARRAAEPADMPAMFNPPPRRPRFAAVRGAERIPLTRDAEERDRGAQSWTGQGAGDHDG